MCVFGRKLEVKTRRPRGRIQTACRTKAPGLKTQPSYYYANTSNYNAANVASQVTPSQPVCSHHRRLSSGIVNCGTFLRARHLGFRNKIVQTTQTAAFNTYDKKTTDVKAPRAKTQTRVCVIFPKDSDCWSYISADVSIGCSLVSFCYCVLFVCLFLGGGGLFSVSSSSVWQVAFSVRRRPMCLTGAFTERVCVCVCVRVTNSVYSEPVGSLRVLHVAWRGNGRRKWGAIRGERERRGEEKKKSGNVEKGKSRDIEARGYVTAKTVQ